MSTVKWVYTMEYLIMGLEHEDIFPEGKLRTKALWYNSKKAWIENELKRHSQWMSIVASNSMACECLFQIYLCTETLNYIIRQNKIENE